MIIQQVQRRHRISQEKRQDKVITILFSRTVSKAEMRGLKDTEY